MTPEQRAQLEAQITPILEHLEAMDPDTLNEQERALYEKTLDMAYEAETRLMMLDIGDIIELLTTGIRQMQDKRKEQNR